MPRSLWLLRLSALAYTGVGLWAMLVASPRVPYADTYRFLATFLSLPFPANALAADNGHREVLPNLIRIAELEWLDANQWLQIGVGFTFAIATLLLIATAFRTASRPARVAVAAIASVGLFWLGNGRKLAHGSESMHLFLVLGTLVIGLRLLVRLPVRLPARLPRSGGMARAAGVATTGLVATLSFGSGAACFPAFFVVLLLQRAPWRHWLPIIVGAGIAAAALLGAGEGKAASVEFAPVEQLVDLLHWLGAPFVWVLSPFLDAAHAARLPGPFSAPMLAIAGPLEAALGPRLSAPWPATAFGGLGMLWLLIATVRTWRRRDDVGDERLALGLAWFGFAVGLLVVTARLGYFREYPEQLTTARYLPWSMMCWTGLMLRFVLRCGRSTRTLVWTTGLVALLLLPSQVWTGRNMFRQQDAADLTAVGAAVGVLDRDFDLVETKERDLRRSIPLLRDGRKAMFAWPETAWLDRRPEVAAPRLIHDLIVDTVDNFWPTTGSHVSFGSAIGSERLLLMDADGIAHGIAIHTGPGDRWQGWLRGTIEPADLRAAALR